MGPGSWRGCCFRLPAACAWQIGGTRAIYGTLKANARHPTQEESHKAEFEYI